jgi:hypothetical protein
VLGDLSVTGQGEQASIIYGLDAEVSLGVDEHLDAGCVASRCGKTECSLSLRSAHSSYAHTTIFGTQLMPQAPWRMHLAYPDNPKNPDNPDDSDNPDDLTLITMIILITLITIINQLRLKTIK